MNIILKTKEELLKEGWTESHGGSLYNSDYDDDIGHFSWLFTNLLGKKLKVLDYLKDFYIVEHTFLLNGTYITKAVVKEVEETDE